MLLRSFIAAASLTIAASTALSQAPSPQTKDESTSTSTPTFDVASIRQNNSDEHARSHIVSSSHDGRLTVINVPLNMLLSFAFAMPQSRITGIPAPLNSQKFDIEAKSDPSVDDQLSKLSSDQGKLQKQLMIQALLADRFKLATHIQVQQLPVFNLVIAKNGPKLEESKVDGRTYNTRNGQLSDQGITIPVLADQIASQLDRPVIDKTALTGRYDITLKWTPDNATQSASDSAPSIFTAVQEQLGLKLESTKGPVETLVIDHIEAPSPN